MFCDIHLLISKQMQSERQFPSADRCVCFTISCLFSHISFPCKSEAYSLYYEMRTDYNT